MKMIQFDFPNIEQALPGNKTGSEVEMAYVRDFTINLSPQCRAFRRALKTETLKPLFPGPVSAWIIKTLYK